LGDFAAEYMDDLAVLTRAKKLDEFSAFGEPIKDVVIDALGRCKQVTSGRIDTQIVFNSIDSDAHRNQVDEHVKNLDDTLRDGDLT